MFTGLVEAVGEVVTREAYEEGLRFVIAAASWGTDVEEGESVAIDGVCHTVTAVRPDGFEFTSIRTTLSRTTLGEFQPGRRVNLERPVRAGAPLGGHIVQGHVDGVGTLTAVTEARETVFLSIQMPEEVATTTVLHGSLAVDGVSLTVNALARNVAEVAIIPYTWNHTNLSRLRAGDRVNLEADLVGKVVRRLMEPYLEPAAGRSPREETETPDRG
ncbi:MAG: riboflavin synthase [Gemmatimonadota bacterium]